MVVRFAMLYAVLLSGELLKSPPQVLLLMILSLTKVLTSEREYVDKLESCRIQLDANPGQVGLLGLMSLMSYLMHKRNPKDL